MGFQWVSVWRPHVNREELAAMPHSGRFVGDTEVNRQVGARRTRVFPAVALDPYAPFKIKPLANLYIPETKARQHAGKRLAGIFVGGLQDAVLQCGCLKLALSFLAYLAFKIRIGRGEESGVARIDSRLRVVEASGEDFGLRQVNRNAAPAYHDVAGLKLRQIQSGDHLAVHHQQQTIAREKFRQDGILALAADNFVHGVADCLEALERPDLADDGGLVHADVNLSATQHAAEFEEAESSERP